MRNLIITYLFMLLTFGAYCQEPDLSNPKNYKRSSSFPYTVGQKNSVLKNVQKALGLVPTGNFDEYTEHILLSKGYNLEDGLPWDTYQKINVDYQRTKSPDEKSESMSIFVNSFGNYDKSNEVELTQSKIPIQVGGSHFIIGRIQECLNMIPTNILGNQTIEQIKKAGFNVNNGITIDLYQSILKNCDCKNCTEKSLNNGAIYKGQLSNGIPDGKGLIIDTNGNVIFDGEWEKGKMNGLGVSFNPSSTYVGQFENNIENGKGIVYTKNGTILIDGEFSNGIEKANGKMYHPDGTISYEGELVNLLPNGLGTQFENNGRKYYGYFKDNQRNGHGIVYNSDGTISYNGEWKNNSASGFGISYLNSEKYKGEFKNGQPNGKGVLTYANGENVQGLWENGNFISTQNNTATQNTSDERTYFPEGCKVWKINRDGTGYYVGGAKGYFIGNKIYNSNGEFIGTWKFQSGKREISVSDENGYMRGVAKYPAKNGNKVYSTDNQRNLYIVESDDDYCLLSALAKLL